MFMKFCRWFTALCLVAGTGVQLVSGQPGIPVYLEPDANSTQVATIDPEQLPLIDALSVLEETKAAEGWMFTEYYGTFVGFVDPNSVAKGLLIRPNTPAYLRPDIASPVLALIREEDDYEIIRAGTAWTEIEFQKLVPVYFRMPRQLPDSTPADLSSRDESPLLANETRPEPPVDVPPVDRTADATEIEELPALETPPEVPLDTTVLTDEGENVLKRVPPGSPATDIPQYIEGRLERSSRIFGFKPKHKFELKIAGNRRIAWVDLSNVLVSSIATYEDRQVVIYGDILQTEGIEAPLVRARTIRLK